MSSGTGRATSQNSGIELKDKSMGLWITVNQKSPTDCRGADPKSFTTKDTKVHEEERE